MVWGSGFNASGYIIVASMFPATNSQDETLLKPFFQELGGAGVYSVDLWKKTILEAQSLSAIP